MSDVILYCNHGRLDREELKVENQHMPLIDLRMGRDL